MLKDRADTNVLHYKYAAIASDHTNDVCSGSYETILQCITGQTVRSALAPHDGDTQTEDVGGMGSA